MRRSSDRRIVTLCKTSLLAFLLFFMAQAAGAQPRPIGSAEYEKHFDYAVTHTNADFPFVFTVTTDLYRDGKVTKSVVEREERQAMLFERQKRKTTVDGNTTFEYQISAGFSNNFCSEDGKSWTRSKYMCFGPVSFYRPEDPLTVEYSIENRTDDRRKVKVLRKLEILPQTGEKYRRRFSEETSTLDGRGFFVSVITREGVLDPEDVTLIRTQIWAKERFPRIVVPKVP